MEKEVVTIDLTELKARLWDRLHEMLDDTEVDDEDVLIAFIHQVDLIDEIKGK